MSEYEKTCEFCMYEAMDEAMYPCSRCTCNNPTENKFMPKAEYDSGEESIENNAVEHPSHYTDGKIEVIDFIEDKKFPYHLGNAIKYISRAGKKDPSKEIEDLQKAVWYINRYIEMKGRE